MCGIAGYVGRGDARERLERMNSALVHRGPDDAGTAVDRRGGLAMRRLSIVGVANGQQPIANEDDSLTIVGNGEIYNAPELRRQLEARGHRFRSDSDIETALHLFEDEGEAAFERLNGMFALAIREREGRTLLVRDRVGIKPLFHASSAAGTVFASELPAIRAGLAPGESGLLEVDPIALHDYLRLGYVPGPATIHRGVRRLDPGHLLWISGDGAVGEARPWWSLPSSVPDRATADSPDLDGWAEQLVELIQDSVRLRTRGEVPGGAFLSGGLDSSTLVGLLARHFDRALPVFTLGIGDRAYDEVDDARRTAEHFGCTHHVESLGEVTADELDGIFRHFGEPFGDVSLLPTHRVARLASREVKFVISGDGGDELFGGYSWLAQEVRWRRLPAAVLGAARCLRPLLRHGQGSLRNDVVGRALRAAGDIASDPATSFLRRRSLCPPSLASELFPPHRRDALQGRLTPLERHAREWSGDRWGLLLDLDRRFSLAGDILDKIDRATMAHSLEARVPLLDHRIVEFAARIPATTHLGTTEPVGKAVLRRAIGRLLPRELLERPKRGFGLPVDHWFRGPLGDELEARLRDRSFRSRDLVDPGAAERLLEGHRQGRVRGGHILWALWSLSAWATEGVPTVTADAVSLA